MSCEVWAATVPAGSSVDDLCLDDRQKLFDHIRDCRTCRRVALSADSTLVFASLPRVEVSATEIEQIRSSVRILRRAREVENASSLGRWARRAAAVAALLFVALLLDPKRPDQVAEDSPFAGALGVGAGQLDLSPSTVPAEDSRTGSTATAEIESTQLDSGDPSDARRQEDAIEKPLSDTSDKPLE